MYSPESGKMESAPLLPIAERNMHGYVIFFASTESAREAIENFWAKIDPSIKELIDRRVLHPETQQITGGPRTEFFPVKKERQEQGYQAAVFFSGNGMFLQPRGLDALMQLGYLSGNNIVEG